MPPSPDPLAAEARAIAPAASRTLVAVMIDRLDRHARELLQAFAAAGVRALAGRRAKCGCASESQSGRCLPGLDQHLPDAVLVREIPGGTFEAVTMRLGVLHALRELGVPVWNDARAIERCVDKSTT